jgi:F-type H+-transporting ATPase subunit gamma
MPSLKAVRLRIASVKSTQKITKAMKLVAAAKLRRAQDAITAARPYAKALAQAVAEVAVRAGDAAHPLLEQRPIHRVALVALTSDRGLCGAFNTNVGRAVQRFIEERQRVGGAEQAGGEAADIAIDVVGRKGREYFKRRKTKVARELAGVTSAEAIDRAKQIAGEATDRFARREVDAVYLVYNEFKSAVSQNVRVEQLLPITPALPPDDAVQIDFLYEPSKAELLSIMVPLYIENQVFRAILESIASEFGARMSAMENATTNASEMIEKLTLQYNRARQAAITKELMEIVGGAEALKG